MIEALLFVSLLNFLLLTTILVREQKRTDRYASALLATRSENRAAAIVSPAQTPKTDQNPLTRPRQVGLSPR